MYLDLDEYGPILTPSVKDGESLLWCPHLGGSYTQSDGEHTTTLVVGTPNSILSLKTEREDNPHRSHRTLRQAYLQHKSAEGAICVRHVSVSGALQFAVFHAICRVLHRPASRVIHCPELSRQSALWLITIRYLSLFKNCFQVFKDTPSPGRDLRDRPQQTILPPGGLEELVMFQQQDYFGIKIVSDPSAGSPTETLLRLLLPLDDAVRFSFRSASRDKPHKQPVRGPH